MTCLVLLMGDVLIVVLGAEQAPAVLAVAEVEPAGSILVDMQADIQAVVGDAAAVALLAEGARAGLARAPDNPSSAHDFPPWSFQNRSSNRNVTHSAKRRPGQSHQCTPPSCCCHASTDRKTDFGESRLRSGGKRMMVLQSASTTTAGKARAFRRSSSRSKRSRPAPSVPK